MNGTGYFNLSAFKISFNFMLLPRFVNKKQSTMPKEAQSSLSKVRGHVARYPKEFSASTREELFCTLCSTVVSHGRKFSVDKHRQSAKHRKALGSTSQQLQQVFTTPRNTFDLEWLCWKSDSCFSFSWYSALQTSQSWCRGPISVHWSKSSIRVGMQKANWQFCKLGNR